MPSLTFYDLWCADLVSNQALARLMSGCGSADEAIERIAAERPAPADGLREEVARGRAAADRALTRVTLSPVRVIESSREHGVGEVDSPWMVAAGCGALRAGLAVAIVGTRRLDARATRTAQRVVDAIVQLGAARVVSGGALGVDGLAQRAALASGRPPTVVCAGGLAHIGPPSHRAEFGAIVEQGGVIVTERPPQMAPQRYEFVRRNRLIAVLSDVVVVVRAPADSGALATARFARQLGRPVLVVPGEPDDPLCEGCHDLLRQGGGRICTGADDVRRALGLEVQATLELAGVSCRTAPAVPADPVAAALLARWRELGTLDAALESTGIGAGAGQGIVMGLELDGFVERTAGGTLRPVGGDLRDGSGGGRTSAWR